MRNNKLPLILSFSVEEERGHFITGKGICYIEKIHGTSRVTLGGFCPFRLLHALKNSETLYATFEIKEETHGCVLRDLTFGGNTIVATLPENLHPSCRRYLRVEPSLKSPVVLYLKTASQGTVALRVKNISERGLGFTTPSSIDLDVGTRLLCGISLPIEERPFILTDAAVVSKKELDRPGGKEQDGRRRIPYTPAGLGEKAGHIHYGLEVFPHDEDRKKIRLYIMQREVEIRRLLQ